MFLKHIDLTTALRPSYLPDEVLLYVQDNVGLYEGKYKLPGYQNGQVYLTSHRICYVDKFKPRTNSVALDLRDVDRFEPYAGFWKSSPKVTIVPKPLKQSSLQNRVASSAPESHRNGQTQSIRTGDAHRASPDLPSVSSATWVCTICSFSNPVPSNFDPTTANAHTPLPPCLACGIKPTLAHVLKAAIANANKRASTPSSAITTPLPFRPPPRPDSRPTSDSPAQSPSTDLGQASQIDSVSQSYQAPTVQCPRCTFSNHPSLLSCEICGASLVGLSNTNAEPARVDSPGPTLDSTKSPAQNELEVSDSIKISFRTGGDKVFCERLKGSMTQRKWLLQDAPPVPKSGRMADDSLAGAASGTNSPVKKTAGIAGLEQLGLNMRKNNELLIGSAFEDLEALMASAKDVVALAERFARQTNGGGDGISAEENALLAESANQLGLITTRDIVGGGSSETLYLSELARNVAEFLTDDSRGVLKKAGGIITLVDLWAMFNRARGGVELVSPRDFEKAARMWEELTLPIRLRTFRSGVMVVQGHDRTDQATIGALKMWLSDLRHFPPDQEVGWDWQEFGRGITAQDAAERFGWSIGVAEEELLMAEEHGAVCREEGLEGLKFWMNLIDTGDIPPPKSLAEKQDEEMYRALKASGLL